MADVTRRWFQRPWMVGMAILIGIILCWLAVFGWEFGRSVILIRSGQLKPLEDPMKRRFQSSVSSLFANTNVTAKDLARIEQGTSPTLGNPAAHVHIVEFIDYECPFCRASAPVVRDFMRKHSNDAYLILRDFPITDLHPDAERVGVAARCVFEQHDQERYWLYHDRLFASQEAHTKDDLLLYAQQIGIDTRRLNDCMATQATLPILKTAEQDGLAAGVTGTPTFFFNGVQIQGTLDAESMETIFQTALKATGN